MFWNALETDCGRADGAGCATPRRFIAHHQHGEDDRGDGNQNAKFAARGSSARLICNMISEIVIFSPKVYFGKTRDIVYDLRSVDDLAKARRQRELQKELVGFIKR